MFDNKWRMRFTRFGNAMNFNSELAFLNNNIAYRSIINVSPEIVLNGQDLYWHCDIWSLGILITQLFTGITSYLYEDKGEKETVEGFRDKIMKFYETRKMPLIVDLIENIYIKAFVRGLLRFEPDDRPNIFRVADIFNKLLSKIKKEEFCIKYEKSEKEEFMNRFPLSKDI